MENPQKFGVHRQGESDSLSSYLEHEEGEDEDGEEEYDEEFEQ
jgi:hypothetical protein